MADFTDIDFNTLLPGEPWTSAKAIASFENLFAFAEQATGAPKMAWKTVAASRDGTGNITISSLAGYGGAYCVIAANFSATSGSDADVAISLNTGAGFASNQTIFSVGGPVDRRESVVLFVDFLSGNWRAVAAGSSTSGNFTGVSGNVTSLRLTLGGTGGSLGVMATLQGGESAS